MRAHTGPPAPLTPAPRRGAASAVGDRAWVAIAILALALGGCASSTSSAGFSGEQHDAAQTIVDLQSDVNASNQKKICEEDLAGAVVAKLDASPGGCQTAIKEQLAEVDNAEVKVDSVTLGSGSSAGSATAHVRSIYAGKTRSTTVTLRKEGGRWKIATLY